MLNLDAVLDSLCKKLDASPPAPDVEGDRLFELADGLRLGIRPRPAGDGYVIWSEVMPGDPGRTREEEEALAAHFLRLRLARLRREAGMVATRGRSGAFLLYSTLSPDTADEWLDGISGLLNETEIARRFLSAAGEPSRAPERPPFNAYGAWYNRP